MIKSHNNPAFRPSIPPDTGASVGYINLMKRCWDDEPTLRIYIKEIVRDIIKLNKEKKL